MSAARACTQCRTAKARCQYLQGSATCVRCSDKNITCSGRPTATSFRFQNENEVAQRNSERARREQPPRPSPSWQAITYEISPPSTGQQGAILSDKDQDQDLQRQYPWLNAHGLASVPEPLKRDLETRAIDRFFVDWILHPANKGNLIPGHMCELAEMYHSSSADCVLTLAVKAIAFADMKDVRDGDTTFAIKARRTYGAALAGMRTAALDVPRAATDRILAALLLLDNFELMYLAREEPLGPHSDAVRHVLHLRGEEQLYSGHSFALWRLAHHRLQGRQMLMREAPNDEEISWMNKLNVNRPDLHFSADVLHMSILCAAAKKLVENTSGTAEDKAQRSEQARHLAGAIQSLLASIESWTSHMAGVWRPKMINSQNLMFTPIEISTGHAHAPPPEFLHAVLEYQETWIANAWNFHSACQIVLRESLIEITKYAADMLSQPQPSEEGANAIRTQEDAIRSLSTLIVESIPPLLGFSDDPAEQETSGHLHQGRMVARQALRYPTLILRKAPHVPEEHKRIAQEANAWINSVHGLG